MSETTLDERFKSLSDTLAAGDVESAIEDAVAIERADPPELLPALADLEAAISDGDVERARMLLNAVTDRYDEVAVERNANTARAKAASTVLAVDDDRTRIASSFERVDGRADLTRAELSTTTMTYLVRPADERTESDRREARQVVQRLRDYERARTAVADRAGAVADTVTVPPTVAVLGTGPTPPVVEVGASKEVEITLGNVGDEALEGADLNVEADGSLDVSSKTKSVGKLGPGKRTTASVTIEGTETGRSRLAVEASTTDGRSDTMRQAIQVVEQRTSGSGPSWLGIGIVGLLATLVGGGYVLARDRKKREE